MDSETKPDDMGDEYDPRRLRDVTYVRHHNGYSVGGKHDGSGAWVMMRAEPDGPWRKRVIVARAVATQSACLGLTVAELEGVSVKAIREALRMVADRIEDSRGFNDVDTRKIYNALGMEVPWE